MSKFETANNFYKVNSNLCTKELKAGIMKLLNVSEANAATYLFKCKKAAEKSEETVAEVVVAPVKKIKTETKVEVIEENEVSRDAVPRFLLKAWDKLANAA